MVHRWLAVLCVTTALGCADHPPPARSPEDLAAFLDTLEERARESGIVAPEDVLDGVAEIERTYRDAGDEQLRRERARFTSRMGRLSGELSAAMRREP